MIRNLARSRPSCSIRVTAVIDKGACSSYGCEKDFTFDVARQLKPLLEAKGLKVVMTRESDVFVPLEMRARIANATRDSIFVSIHFNATE